MAVQIRKTYRGISPDMLCDEIRDLMQKQEIAVVTSKSQTYALPSGLTQSRISLIFKTQTTQKKKPEECGQAHIIDSPGGKTKLLLDLNNELISQETISTLQGDLDFILGSYEAKW